jgi:hypothetical protein
MKTLALMLVSLTACSAAQAGGDAGLSDSGVVDSGRPDAGTPDSGISDAGMSDSGIEDAGCGLAGDGGGWCEYAPALTGCACQSPRPPCTQGPSSTFADLRGSCDAGEVCVSSACAPADFGSVGDGEPAPKVSGSCDSCGHCSFACGSWQGYACPQTCVLNVRAPPGVCADGPTSFCFVAL